MIEDIEKLETVPTRASGPAIVSLILGIISLLCCSFIPVGFLCGVTGLICGIHAIRKCKPSTGTDIAGIVTSSIGIAVFVIILGSAAYIFGSLDNYNQLAPHTFEIIGDIDTIVTEYDKDGTLPDYLEEHRDAWADVWSRCGDSLVEGYGISEDTADTANPTSEGDTVTGE